MSDVLQRLVDRASARGARIEPILPSIYARQPQEPVTLSEEFSSPVVNGEVDSPGVLAPGPRSAAVVQNNLEMPRNPARASEEAENQEVAAPSLLAAPARHQPGAEPDFSLAAKRRIESQGARMDEMLSARQEAGEITGPRVEALRLVETGELTSETGREPRGIPRPTRARRAALDSRSIEEARPMEEAAPIEINVSIGHIEVRAAPQAPPVRRTPPRRPRVSLEDYLNGGGKGAMR